MVAREAGDIVLVALERNPLFISVALPHRFYPPLFLADPADYDGGELVIEDMHGTHAVKLAAGHMIVYPADSRHRAAPVTRGVRIASVFWVQSLVRDDARRFKEIAESES